MRPWIFAALTVAALAACSPTNTTPAAKPAAPAGKPQVLQVAQLDGFSPIVVNGNGRTIYRFEKDSNNPPTASCVDNCLQKWQPVLAPNGVKVNTGVEEDLVGSVARPDGAAQLTLNGWPMYYFHTDLRLGQTAGQGVDDLWFAISPIGGKAEQTTGVAAPSGKRQVLRVTDVDGLSPAVVVNGKDRTIYRFENDSNNPPRTSCVDRCVKKWQPVLAPGGVQVNAGIDADLVDTLTRPDGSKQVTLNGWPLYYFHSDLKLGQIAGQGVDDLWFAITPGGGKAQSTSDSDSY